MIGPMTDGATTVTEQITMEVSTQAGVDLVHGRVLGRASSRRERHTHPPGTHPAHGERCSACRWMEVVILHDLAEPEDEDRVYAIVTEGKSVIQGETTRGRVERTTSPHWVVEYLSKRDGQGELYMPVVSKKAVAEAASRDPRLDDAYVNRALP